ncbi:MAG: ABC transporter ATP-binding protein [Eubacteriales bacterium]|nr:ABC transporter ATP-binding protein [Eubacteriales bacterium]
MSYLEVRELTKIYGRKQTAVTALDHVSFSVEKGEFVAIVGASGSGKSTLLHMLGGVDTATSGSVLLQDEDVFTMKEERRAIFRRRRVGFIFQEYNLIPVLSVEENIKMPVRLDKKQMNPAYLEQLLQMLGLVERRKNLPDELSGGQKQRVAIGRALANHPSMILADEPTGNLDHNTGLEIMALLKKSVEEFSQTLILVTHDEAIAAMADRIITLSDGQIQSDIRIKHAISERW